MRFPLRYRLGVWAWALLPAMMVPVPAQAQLRPLDPVDFSALGEPGWIVETGFGAFTEQRASLAGVSGDLVELGTSRIVWGLGRVALELSATLLRIYEDQEVYTDPVGDARPSDGRARIDAGDLRVSTMIRLTDDQAGVPLVLRFGTRLPTTDNRVGLGRDQTDFFATLGTQGHWGPWRVGVEGGFGVHGTRDTGHEQIDPILFGMRASYHAGAVRPLLELTGQHDPRSDRDRRGNENIGEIRLGARFGGGMWLSVLGVRGWTSTSPALGLMVRAGKSF